MGGYLIFNSENRKVNSESDPEDIIILIDTSISMNSKDYKPNRLEAAKKAIMLFIRRALELNPYRRIGIIGFYMYAYPIVDLTRNINALEEAVKSIKVMGEATAPGEAVKEAIKMFKIQSTPAYKKRIIFVTDGTFNEGVPLSIMAEYARRCNVRIDICSFGRLSDYDREEMEKAVKLTGGKWEYARKADEIMSSLLSLIVGSK